MSEEGPPPREKAESSAGEFLQAQRSSYARATTSTGRSHMVIVTSTPFSASAGSDGSAVALARGVHTEMLEANQSLVNRAQVLLTLDGVVVGVIGAGLKSKPADLGRVVDVLGGRRGP
jgi:hypothetical protein